VPYQFFYQWSSEVLDPYLSNVNSSKKIDSAIYSHSKTLKVLGVSRSSELSEMISSWALAIDQDSGYILRSFKRNLSNKPCLTPASINHILKSLQKTNRPESNWRAFRPLI